MARRKRKSSAVRRARKRQGIIPLWNTNAQSCLESSDGSVETSHKTPNSSTQSCPSPKTNPCCYSDVHWVRKICAMLTLRLVFACCTLAHMVLLQPSAYLDRCSRLISVSLARAWASIGKMSQSIDSARHVRMHVRISRPRKRRVPWTDLAE